MSDRVPRPTATIRLLGHFRVELDGKAVELPQAESRLAAALALQATPVTRDWIAGRLWPEVANAVALRRLRSTLCRLNRCSPHTVCAERDSIGLVPGVSVDLHRARHSARRLGNGEALADDLEIELFRNDVLMDWYEAWIEDDRESFRQIRIHALEHIAKRLNEAGRHGEAIEACLVVLRSEPFRETTHRLLVQTHAAEGNNAQALAHAHSYERALRAELGVDPEPGWAGLG